MLSKKSRLEAPPLRDIESSATGLRLHATAPVEFSPRAGGTCVSSTKLRLPSGDAEIVLTVSPQRQDQFGHRPAAVCGFERDHTTVEFGGFSNER